MPTYTSFLEAAKEYNEWLNSKYPPIKVMNKIIGYSRFLWNYIPENFYNEFDKWLLSTNSSIIPNQKEINCENYRL